MNQNLMSQIDYIKSYGFEVIDHGDGKFTIYDSLDPENGWKIIREESALKEALNMLSLATD